MINSRSILVGAIGIFFLASCSNNTEPKEQAEETPATEEPQMREYSELAGIMVSVHAYQSILKDSIKAGAKELPSPPIELQKLHTAEATDSRELDGDYHALADNFIGKLDSLKYLAIEDRLDAYNASVSTCVECHQTRCPGPIPRIKKLYVKSPIEFDS